MSCKYCFQTDHTIETCKSILCKSCKEIGHPYWLCKKNEDKKTSSNSRNGGKRVEKNLPLPPKVVKREVSQAVPAPQLHRPSVMTQEAKCFVKGDLQKQQIINETKRDLHFYMKQSLRRWSDIL
jgi:hypothetical protein